MMRYTATIERYPLEGAGMIGRSRLNVFTDHANGLLIVRPIGIMAGFDFVERLVEAYNHIDRPWLYNRLVDLRRFEGELSDADCDGFARAWARLTAGVTYHAYIASVVNDRHDGLRQPERSEHFAHETVCFFRDYHEAIGWLLAEDRDDYLAGLGDMPAAPANDISLYLE